MPSERFDRQSSYHVTLADDLRAEVIQRAARRGGSLVEAHTHLGPFPAAFSASDIAGLDEWVPHVRWRLGGSPYVALVLAETGFDALVWDRGTEPERLEALDVPGRGHLVPTGITLGRLAGHER